MAEAVAGAIADERHLIVQAGTGTGKSLAYLVPALLSGGGSSWPPPPRRSRTSWRARTCRSWPSTSAEPFAFAVLKGRSNYLCRQRLAEVVGRRAAGPRRSRPTGLAERARQLLQSWAADSPTGDRAELPVEPSPPAWAAVSVGPRRSAPARARCPKGDECFAEAGPPTRRRGRRGGGQHPPLRARPRPPAVPSCPNTTSWSSTRPTSSRTSSRPRRARARRRSLRRRWRAAVGAVVDEPTLVDDVERSGDHAGVDAGRRRRPPACAARSTRTSRPSSPSPASRLDRVMRHSGRRRHGHRRRRQPARRGPCS